MRAILGALTLAVMPLAPAQAVEIVRFTVASTARWANPVLVPGTPAVDITGNGTTDARVRWGVNTGEGQSGYDLVGASRIDVDLIEGGDSEIVFFGLFHHINAPIEPGGISAIDLQVNVTIAAPDGQVADILMPFHFVHDETDNTLATCPYGGVNGQGINRNGCADMARTDSAMPSHILEMPVGRVTYRIFIGGFVIARQTVSEFLTAERTTGAWASLILQISHGDPPGATVPEPASWATMIAGFGLVGVRMRRRRMIAA